MLNRIMNVKWEGILNRRNKRYWCAILLNGIEHHKTRSANRQPVRIDKSSVAHRIPNSEVALLSCACLMEDEAQDMGCHL